VSDAARVQIRPYRPADRSAVRHVCVETGFLGEPVQWQWRDAESFADLFCGWYTDHEPGSAQVATLDGRVVGYLLGCRDTTRVADPVRAIVPQVLRRALLVRPGTAGVLWRAVADGLADAVRGQLPPEPVRDDRWPAHLHVDLLPEARGAGVGERLLAGWLGTLRGAGAAGCHLETMAENHAAIAFFERQGFRREGAVTRVPGLRARDGTRLHTQLMVHEL
jgi:ribosomal protein S18 acetylase RimI-like enzyme